MKKFLTMLMVASVFGLVACGESTEEVVTEEVVTEEVVAEDEEAEMMKAEEAADMEAEGAEEAAH